MEKRNTGNWIERHKYTSAVLVMLIIWGSLLVYFVVYSEAIMNDPCSTCAKQMGEEVRCTAGTYQLSHKTFFADGNISEDYPERRKTGDFKINANNLSDIEV